MHYVLIKIRAGDTHQEALDVGLQEVGRINYESMSNCAEIVLVGTDPKEQEGPGFDDIVVKSEVVEHSDDCLGDCCVTAENIKERLAHINKKD